MVSQCSLEQSSWPSRVVGGPTNHFGNLCLILSYQGVETIHIADMQTLQIVENKPHGAVNKLS